MLTSIWVNAVHNRKHTVTATIAFFSSKYFVWRLTFCYVYIGWNDVTVSMVTVRSPFSGYNTVKCAEWNGADLSCYSNETKSLSLRKCSYDNWLTNKAYLSAVTVTDISQTFTYTMAAIINRHRYETKLRHSYPMCIFSHLWCHYYFRIFWQDFVCQYLSETHKAFYLLCVYSFLPFVALVTWLARPSVGLRNEKGHDVHLTLKRIFRSQTVVRQVSALRRGWPLGLKTRKQLSVTGNLAVKEMWKSVCVYRRPKIVRLVCYWDTVYLLLQVGKKSFPILVTERWARSWSRCTGSQPAGDVKWITP